MFGLGWDLKRLFAQVRNSQDRTWLELIGADLLEAEARARSDEAYRQQGKHPIRSLLAASAAWREHARRTGRRESLARALDAANDAGMKGAAQDRVAVALEAAHCLMLDHEQRGSARFTDIEAILEVETQGLKAGLMARLSATHARLAALRARHGGDAQALMDASALLDAALHDLSRRADLSAEAVEIRLERASLGLEAGLRRREPLLLDQAGRDLRAVVEQAPAEYRPITRARALTLSATGLAALAALAGDETARKQAHQMFEAAADAFTPDHSPLDWAALAVARAAREAAPDMDQAVQAVALTQGQGLILGAVARDHLTALETAQAEIRFDAAQLARMETRLRRRLAQGDGVDAPLDWAVDQMGLARIHMARSRMVRQDETAHLGLMLTEASACAAEHGAPIVAERAEALLKQVVELAEGRA